ncbi:MAG: TIGR02452 family protein [Clostridia bacterium]|nr:TIGR02452 family protein [Clostridia bacterium]
MIDRTALIRCFMDTQRTVRENDALAAATLRMQAGTILYLPGFAAIGPAEKSRDLPLTVVEDTTFHCAGELAAEGRVAVLNFANAYRPGGGVANGAMAQEECLCRSSNLYSALTIPYLLRNYYKHNEKTTGDLGTDAVIYSPGVTVFKSDDPLPVPLAEPFQVDVLTCAAPYVAPDRKKPIPLEKLEDTFDHRIRNILEVAAANGADALVLGAFGCGAFNNPPELVAGCFRHLLVDRGLRDRFRRVVFAIKGGGRNFEVFRDVLTE